MRRICLVTPGHPSTNPRLVKEADSLTEDGAEVHVVAGKFMGWADEADAVFSDREWDISWCPFGDMAPPARDFWYRLRRRVCERIAPRDRYVPGLTDRAFHYIVPELTAAAMQWPADLYIAHNLAALPAAARAADEHHAMLGFDAEDFHRGEFRKHDQSKRKKLTELLEAKYVPLCGHLTAASEGIAQAYSDVFAIEEPNVVLNVFPLLERKGQTPQDELKKEKSSDDVISLYWYSQTIGPNRGLQSVLRALPQLAERVHLTLRGRWADGFEHTFRTLAAELDVTNRLRVLPPAPPDQLVERATQHDIGLALEQAHTRNRDVCVTNKLLVYLLAGIPVVATATTGQRHICETVPEAARLCASGGPEAIAEAVRSLMHDGNVRPEARAAAHQAGTERYNWEREQSKLLSAVKETLSMTA